MLMATIVKAWRSVDHAGSPFSPCLALIATSLRRFELVELEMLGISCLIIARFGLVKRHIDTICSPSTHQKRDDEIDSI